MKALIAFYSRYGQTEKIANHIADALRSKSFEVDLLDAQSLGNAESLSAYDIVVVGAPIYTGRHSGKLAKFAKQFNEQPGQRVSAFFSVSLAAAGDQTQKKDAFDCIDRFLARTRWKPNLTAAFAGSLPYRQYNWFTRWMMKRIVRKAGGDIDTSRDYEYTDWNQVDDFAIELIAEYEQSQQREPSQVSA